MYSPNSRHVEWLCVDFSPSGGINPPYTIIMSQASSSAVGRLQGHGEDSLGPFHLSEATLNRSLQWMSVINMINITIISTMFM
jgi:hypothetical protein